MATADIDETLDISRITDKLPTLILATKDTADEVVKIVDEATKKLSELNSVEIKTEYQAKAAYQDVLRVVRSAYAYIDKVDDFFYYGKLAESEATTSIRRGNYQSILAVIDQLCRTLSQVDKFYEEFDTACKNATKSSIRAAEMCNSKKKEARESKNFTTLAGSLATVGAVALGAVTLGASVPLSFAAFGIGAGIGAGTSVLANQFDKAEKTFRELGETFKSLERTLIYFNNEIETINVGLKTTATRIKDMEINAKARQKKVLIVAVSQATDSCRAKANTKGKQEEDEANTHDTNQVLAWSANRLFTKLDMGHKELAPAIERADKKKSDLEKAVERLYSDSKD